MGSIVWSDRDYVLKLEIEQRPKCWCKISVRYSDTFDSLLDGVPWCKEQPRNKKRITALWEDMIGQRILAATLKRFLGLQQAGNTGVDPDTSSGHTDDLRCGQLCQGEGEDHGTKKLGAMWGGVHRSWIWPWRKRWWCHWWCIAIVGRQRGEGQYLKGGAGSRKEERQSSYLELGKIALSTNNKGCTTQHGVLLLSVNRCCLDLRNWLLLGPSYLI